MLTFINMVTSHEKPSAFRGDDFRAMALFAGIGFLVALIAASTGEQGVWL